MSEKEKGKEKRGINCCVPQCSTPKGTEGFVYFPKKNLELQKLWFQKLGLENKKINVNYHRVCRAHFTRNDFLTKKIKPDAFPTQNLPVRQFPQFPTFIF